MKTRKQSLVNKFNEIIAQTKHFNYKMTVVVAVSAGVDSMALINLMLTLPADLRPHIVVAHVNHKLRGQSDEEEQYLKVFCKKHNLPLKVRSWPISQHPTNGIEAAARNFRYAFFADVMHQTGAKVLLTAHHGNDQAETVLMKLIRGSFVKHISGIQEARPFGNGELFRPLLGFTKQQIKKYMQINHMFWYEDATNQVNDVLRNRIRNNLLPQLSQENSHIVEHLDRFSQQLKRLNQQNDFLFQRLLSDIMQGDGKMLLTSEWYQLPISVQIGALDYWLVHQVKLHDFNDDLIKEVIKLLNNPLKPQGQIQITDNLIVKKSYDYFFVENVAERSLKLLKNRKTVVTLNQWFAVDDGHKFMIADDLSSIDTRNYREADLRLSKDDWPLIVQSTQNHDKITLKNGGHQTARRIFINGKVPTQQRRRACTLLTRQGRVLAILGYRESFLPYDDHKDKYTLLIK
jgi:tRNA(Ile)-lysidine synthetase-like protein